MIEMLMEQSETPSSCRYWGFLFQEGGSSLGPLLFMAPSRIGYPSAKKYMENFVEIKVRMTADKRSIVQEHAANMGESATAFINRAIDETMEHDKTSDKED